MQAGFVACALGVALWSARRSLAASSSRTGEMVWSIVAVAILVGVSLTVGLGGGHGV